jgi:hypothetical protein
LPHFPLLITHRGGYCYFLCFVGEETLRAVEYLSKIAQLGSDGDKFKLRSSIINTYAVGGENITY